MRIQLALLALSVLTLSACADTVPDYRIGVTEQADGTYTATAPNCPAYSGSENNPFDNQTTLQFGCANARNLAAMIDNPRDIVRPRDPGLMHPQMATQAVDRYLTGKTYPLYDPNAAAPAANNSGAAGGDAGGGAGTP